MRMTIVAWILVLALMGTVACELTSPSGVPRELGSVISQVIDDSGAPLANVWVYVHDIPNNSGSSYTVGVPTNASGTATFDPIPAGRHRVDVKPPPGYPAPVTVTVNVVQEQSVTIGFVLTKRSG